MSVLGFSASASVNLIVGKTTEVGSGDKSPSNPYQLQGETDFLPLGMDPLYGDGTINDEYDAATGIETRRWKRLELDGTENWQLHGTGDSEKYRYALEVEAPEKPENQSTVTNALCSHYVSVSSGDTWLCTQGMAMNHSEADLLFFYDDTYNTNNLSAWKSWLAAQKAAGTPVTVLYRLAEPVVIQHKLSSSTNSTLYLDYNDFSVYFSRTDGTTIGLNSVGNNDYSYFFYITNPVKSFCMDLEFSEAPYVFQLSNRYVVSMSSMILMQYATINSANITLYGSGNKVIAYGLGTVGVDGSYSKVSFNLNFQPAETLELNAISVELDVSNTGTYPVVLSRYVYFTSINSTQEVVEDLSDKIDEQTRYQKGFFERLGDRIGGFFEGLLDGIKNLFLPSSEYITDFFDDWNTWFADHFGILYYPFDFFIDICTRLLNLQIPDNPSITFPGVEIMGYTLWEDTVYSFDLSALPALSDLHQTYYVVVDVIIALWLINFARKKLNEVMSG